MPIDPICKMTVKPNSSTPKSHHLGVDYFFCCQSCKKKFDENPESVLSKEKNKNCCSTSEEKKTSRDPICGMLVEVSSPLKINRQGRNYYFCSQGCLNTFSNPETELKNLKKRLGLALSSLILIALLRAGAFVFLASTSLFLASLNLNFILFLVSTPVQFIGGYPFYIGAYHALKSRIINMDLMIALGSSVAYFYSCSALFFPQIFPSSINTHHLYFEVSSFIIAFVLLGKTLEEVIKKRSSSALYQLINLQANQVRILQNEKELLLPLEQLKMGDIFLVKPGEKISTDGMVIEGESNIDESMISGEALPVHKKIDSLVTGATLNLDGILKIKATQVGSQTKLAQMIRLLEEAQNSPTLIQRFADKAVSYFVPFVIFSALSAFIVWLLLGNFPQALLSFIAVLIIACPCALGIATPAALAVAVGKAAELGILIRNAESIEKLAQVTSFAFDKTGTLTQGKPSIQIIECEEAFSKDFFLSALFSLEANSKHPLANALAEYTKQHPTQIQKVSNFKSIVGKGLEGNINEDFILVGSLDFLKERNIPFTQLQEEKILLQQNKGHTLLLLSINKVYAGFVALSDFLKTDAKDCINYLHSKNYNLYLLSGDHLKSAQLVASQLGIQEVYASLKPEDKLNIIENLKKKGEVVAMLGDGINDAPALASADIGIAVGAGSDIAKESGSILLLNNNLHTLIQCIQLSQATFQKIKQNLFWALFYNLLAIPLAAFGILNPMIAAAAMACSSVSVLMNSALLKKIKFY